MADELNINAPTSGELEASTAEELLAAEVLEEEEIAAGNVQDAALYEAAAAADNPGGATPFGDADDNTRVETVDPNVIAAVAATTPRPAATPPPPDVTEAGGSGDTPRLAERSAADVANPTVPLSAVRGVAEPTLAPPPGGGSRDGAGTRAAARAGARAGAGT